MWTQIFSETPGFLSLLKHFFQIIIDQRCAKRGLQSNVLGSHGPRKVLENVCARNKHRNNHPWSKTEGKRNGTRVWPLLYFIPLVACSAGEGSAGQGEKGQALRREEKINLFSSPMFLVLALSPLLVRQSMSMSGGRGGYRTALWCLRCRSLNMSWHLLWATTHTKKCYLHYLKL